MEEKRTTMERWGDYRPSKSIWFWSCVACVALTMILGFTWGGWVTGGTANLMAENAAEESQAELAAAICQKRFLASPDVRVQLTALKEKSSWQQGDMIEEGGWVTFAGSEEPVPEAADLCADFLVDVELPVAEAIPAADASLDEAKEPVAN